MGGSLNRRTRRMLDRARRNRASFGGPQGRRPGDRLGSAGLRSVLAGRDEVMDRTDRRPPAESAPEADDDTGTDERPDGDEIGDRVRVGDGPRRPSPLAGSVLPPRPLREEPAMPGERGERRPMVPSWLREPGPALRWWIGEQLHMAGFHVCHAPEYLGRALAWTPRGLGRGTVGLWRWATDAQSAPLRWHAAETGDVDGYLYLAQQSTARTRARAVTALALLTMVAAAVLVGWGSGLPGRLAVLTAVVGVGGWLGRPADRPLFDHPVLPPSRVKITPDVLTEAFCAARLCNKHGDPDRHQTATFMAPGLGRDGNGWRAVLDLPGGHTASKALGRREEIAAGLGIDEVRVFLERVRGDDGSARRVSIWVADRDPYATAPVLSPLIDAETWSFWDAIPFGVDAQGRPVSMAMVFTALLVGAIPRMGKTYAARIPAAAAALDPTVRGIYFDGKGGADWRPFAQVAYRCGFGARDAVAAHLAQVVKDCEADMERRYDTLGGLPFDACPESKVTPAITANRRLEMPLTLLCIDEVQEYLGHPSFGAEILEGLIRLAKVGPAVGYMLVLATQKPDSDTIPTRLRDVIGSRFALKTMNYQSSDTILGAGAYSSGLDASKFQRSHKGVGILVGADDSPLAEDGPQTVRTHLLDRQSLEAVCARGRALRIAAGTLEGAAVGEDLLDDAPRRSVLDDVASVFAAGEDRLWSETICARLTEDWPDTYNGWGPSELAAALNPYGVTTGQIWAEGRNRRGVVRRAVLDAQTARLNATTSGPAGDRSGPATGLANQGRLAADPARPSTTASAPDQATSDLAHPGAGPDTPDIQDSGAQPLGPGPGLGDDTDHHHNP